MKPTSKLTILVLTFSTLAGSTFAQEPSPREQFKTAVAAFQKGATEDNARKLADLYKQINPPPAVPEEAEFRALKGAAFVKQAGDAAAFAKAAVEFQTAIAAAPWVGEYHYNLAVCEKSAGHFTAAQTALKFAQILARDDKERRDNLALRAELEAAQELAAVKKAEQDKVASAEEDKRQALQAKRDVITKIKNAVNGRIYSQNYPSHSKTSAFDGVNQNELFGGEDYYLHNAGYFNYSWRFFDDRVELCVTDDSGDQSISIRGDAGGAKVTDMRWFFGPASMKQPQAWGLFDFQTGYFYFSTGFSDKNRPLNDSKFDPNKRYGYSRYSPKK